MPHYHVIASRKIPDLEARAPLALDLRPRDHGRAENTG